MMMPTRHQPPRPGKSRVRGKMRKITRCRKGYRDTSRCLNSRSPVRIRLLHRRWTVARSLKLVPIKMPPKTRMPFVEARKTRGAVGDDPRRGWDGRAFTSSFEGAHRFSHEKASGAQADSSLTADCFDCCGPLAGCSPEAAAGSQAWSAAQGNCADFRSWSSCRP
jgi:hypothetical protein